MYFQLTSAMIIYILVWETKTCKRCCIAGKYGTLAWMGRLQKKNIIYFFLFLSCATLPEVGAVSIKHSKTLLIAFRFKRCQGYSGWRSLSMRKTRLQKIKTKVNRINLCVACVLCSQLGQCYNLSEIHILENIYKFKVAILNMKLLITQNTSL